MYHNTTNAGKRAASFPPRPAFNSLRSTADVFPVVASLPPKNSYFSEGVHRTDDRKCVCCSQAKLLNAFFFLPGVHLQIPERFCLKKLKRIRVLKLQKEQKENYSCYHGLFMRCFRFRSSPQPHARDSPIPRPVRLSRSPSHLVSGPGSSRSLRRSLCRRKHKKFLACPSPLGKI